MPEHRRRRPAAPDGQGVPPEPPAPESSAPKEKGVSPEPSMPEETRVHRRQPTSDGRPVPPEPPTPEETLVHRRQPAPDRRPASPEPPAPEEQPAREDALVSRARRKLSGHRTARGGRTLSGRRAANSRRAGKRVVVRSRIRGNAPPWRSAAFALCGVVFAVCAFHLARYATDYVRSVRLSNELRETYLSSDSESDFAGGGVETLDLSGLILEDAATPEPLAPSEQSAPDAQVAAPVQPTPTPTPVPELNPYATMAPVSYPHNAFKLVSERFAKLRRQNEDIIGWLTLPDDMLSEAVVQRDNSYYLRRDYQGYHNTNGAIFLEEHVDLSTRPYTLTLYGHNMKTGTMFACLRNYENLSFYHHNPFITFDTIYEKGRYVIFSTAEVSIDPKDADFSGFFLLDSATATERLHIIKRLAELSKNTCEIDVGVDDQLLLLVTCVGDDEDRRVVAARRVRDGEHEDDLYRTIQTSVAKR